MIEYVSGTLAAKKPTEAIIDVGGLGYRLLIPTSTYEKLPALGASARLICHHHVREDAMLLYGFGSEAERSVFNLLLGVSGVGPKLALAALSALRPSDIRNQILDGDAAMLTRIPGVGRKTAERLIVELRDRFAKMDFGGSSSGTGSNGATARTDALAALEALGFTRAAADKNLRLVLQNHPEAESAEEMIRLALRQ